VNRTRFITAAALGLTLVGALTACSVRPNADEMYLYYTNGSVDTKAFQECVKPNGKGPWQANNDVFALPTSLRTWNIRPTGGDTDQAIQSGSKPTVNGSTTQPGAGVAVYATAEFYLNTNCDGGKDSAVVKFWEQTGRRYGVSSASGEFSQDGWNRMLLNTLVPAEEKAIREVTRNYSADDLDANTNGIWKQMEGALGATFQAELLAKTGGNYLCGPGYDRAKADCPPVRISITDINFADAGIAEARARVFKAEQDAKAALVAAQSQVDVANKLGQAGKNPSYLELKKLETWLAGIQACAQNPNCTTFVGEPDGVAVSK
jgi:hypothetical protein